MASRFDEHELEELWEEGPVEKGEGSSGGLAVHASTLAPVAIPQHPNEDSGTSEGTSKSPDSVPGSHRSTGAAAVPVSTSRKRAPVLPPQLSPEEGVFSAAVDDFPPSSSFTAAQLGTSAPIRIPVSQLPIRKSVDGQEGGDKRFASTFVPPHLLEQQRYQEAFAGGAATFSGVSPSASLKRERLYQRNAILRSTGFIETTPVLRHSFVETLDTVKENAVLRPRAAAPLEASALSQALVDVAETN